MTFKNNKNRHMKSTFKIIPNKNLIIETLSEDVTPKKYLKLKHEEFLHESFNRNYNLITDLRNVNTDGKQNLILSLFYIFIENKGRANRKKSAIIYNDTNLLNKIPSKFRSNTEIKIFPNIDEAQKWSSN